MVCVGFESPIRGEPLVVVCCQEIDVTFLCDDGFSLADGSIAFGGVCRVQTGIGGGSERAVSI